jgi:hypothetical protein
MTDVSTYSSNPDAVYAFDRSTNETFFDTALQMRRPAILKLAVSALVNGTYDSSHDWSILTTRLPQQARDSLVDMVANGSPDLVSEILSDMVFMKVLHGKMRSLEDTVQTEKGSESSKILGTSMSLDRLR